MKTQLKVLLALISFYINQTAISQSIPDYVSDSTLAGWYPFTGNIIDSSGNNRHATLFGANYDSDRFNKQNNALRFDGSNDYALVYHPFDMFPRSLSIWFKAISIGSSLQQIITTDNKDLVNGMTEVEVISVSGQPKVVMSAGNLICTTNVSPNVWNHAVITVSSNKTKMYLNAVLVDSFNATSNYRSTDVNPKTVIGASRGANNSFFNGYVDEIGFWNRALTHCEVYKLYKASILPTRNSLLPDTIKSCGLDSLPISGPIRMNAYKWSNGSNVRTTYVKHTDFISLIVLDSFYCPIYDTALVSIMNPRITPRDAEFCEGDTADLSVLNPGFPHSDCGYMPFKLKQGLTGWYPFCGNANERISNTHNGNVSGAQLSNDRFGNVNSAFTFDGINDYIRINHSYDLLPRTFSVWFHAAEISTALRQVFTTDNNSLNNGMTEVEVIKIGTNDKVVLSAGNIIDTLDITVNNWHHVVILADSSRTQFYLNGVKVFSAPAHSAYHSTDVSNRFIIGASRGMNNSFFKGMIDDVAVWNKILDSQEIRLLYSLKQFEPVYTWSVPDTGIHTKTSVYQNKKIVLKMNNGIHICYDSIFLQTKTDSFRFGFDTLLFTDCSRDSMRVGIGHGWKNISWSHGGNDTFTFVKNTGTYSVEMKSADGCPASDSFHFINPGLPVATITYSDSVNCFGGSDGRLFSSSAGGFEPYSKVWSNSAAGDSATGLSTGEYVFTLEDAYGCTDRDTAQIFQPLRIQIFLLSQDSILCAGDSNGGIRINSSGGTGTHRYYWNDPQNQTGEYARNLPAGTYQVIASDAYGCRDSLSVKISQPDPLTVFITDTDSVRCFGGNDGRAGAGSSGGTGNISYLWNDINSQKTPAATGLESGSYRVIAEDQHGCRDTAFANIFEPLKLQAQILSIDSVTCPGNSDGSMLAGATGGTRPYSYRWNTIPVQNNEKAFALKKGRYKVIITDHYNCADSATAEVHESAVPLTVKIRTRLYAAKGDVIDLRTDPSKSDFTYYWQLSSQFNPVFLTSNPRFRIEETTTVTVEVTNSAGCKGYDTATILVILPLKDLMPNAFSPNRDGKNDTFGPPEMFEVLQFDIFNRWGEMVFRATPENPHWDGTYMGEWVSQGVYLFIITAKLHGSNAIYSYNHTVTVLR